MSKHSNNQSFISDPDRIAEGILSCHYIFVPKDGQYTSGEYTLVYWRNAFYHWQSGCYIAVSDPEMKQLIVRHIQTLNESSFEDDGNIKITTQLVNNVILCIKGRVGITEQRELNSWPDSRERLLQTFSVKNGLVMLDYKHVKPELFDHTPKYFSLSKMPYDYDPKAQCPHWIDFLDDIMQGEKNYTLLLQQWAGYLLTPNLKQQKFLLCVGEGSNGKGVVFEVIQSLLGQENCSQVPLSRFNNPFALYSTYGKMLNATNESTNMIDKESESILKSFVAGDRFTFERKFKEPIFAEPTAKIMISTNALPRFNDKTQGLWRRLLLVPFNRIVSANEQNKALADQLKRELSGILNWAIEGWHRLNQANGFIVPESNKGLVEEYRRDSDPARAFLLENYEEVFEESVIESKELYTQYRKYCEDNGCKAMRNSNFGQQVKAVFPGIQKVRRAIGGKRPWCYDGIASQES